MAIPVNLTFLVLQAMRKGVTKLARWVRSNELLVVEAGRCVILIHPYLQLSELPKLIADPSVLRGTSQQPSVRESIISKLASGPRARGDINK